MDMLNFGVGSENTMVILQIGSGGLGGTKTGSDYVFHSARNYSREARSDSTQRLGGTKPTEPDLVPGAEKPLSECSDKPLLSETDGRASIHGRKSSDRRTCLSLLPSIRKISAYVRTSARRSNAISTCA